MNNTQQRRTLTLSLITPRIGIHNKVPFHVYRAWAGASSSLLSHLNDNPAQALFYMNHNSRPSKDMAVGTATHGLILEPERFMELRREFCRQLPMSQWARCLRMADVVKAHPTAGPLIEQLSHREVSLAWKDVVQGCVCIARLDGISRKLGLIVDIKTTKDPRPDKFWRDAITYKYHLQAAHYWAGAEASGFEVSDYLLITVQSVHPHAVIVQRMPPAALRAGRELRGQLIALWDACLTSGAWPDKWADIVDPQLPAWFTKENNEKEKTQNGTNTEQRSEPEPNPFDADGGAGAFAE